MTSPEAPLSEISETRGPNQSTYKLIISSICSNTNTLLVFLQIIVKCEVTTAK